MIHPVLVTPPAVRPVTIDEVKRNCRIDHSDEDDLLEMLIDVAVSHLDGYGRALGRALISQTWRHSVDEFCDVIRLPLGPMIAITSVQYYDGDDVLQTLASTVYGAFSDEIGPYIELLESQYWPATATRSDAVRITYTAGYGATADKVPAAIRWAILMMIVGLYENRGSVVIGQTVEELPAGVKNLLSPFMEMTV